MSKLPDKLDRYCSLLDDLILSDTHIIMIPKTYADAKTLRFNLNLALKRYIKLKLIDKGWERISVSAAITGPERLEVWKICLKTTSPEGLINNVMK